MTADKLHGAVCCYILLGFGWSRLYLLVERLSPGSLVVSETHNTGGVPSSPIPWNQSVVGGFRFSDEIW
jgi:hypothetical protein